MRIQGRTANQRSASDAVEIVRQELERDDRVATAILFGSVAKGVGRRDSDLDLAVLASGDAEANALRAGLLELSARLAAASGRDIQVVLLDDVEPVLGRQVFSHGRTLLERDPRLTAGCLERILIAYFDGAHHRRLMEEALDDRLAARG